jgi:serine/threonine protein kinase/outer membrane protein assembly factor BamB
MSQTLCSNCGMELPPDAPAGVCPRCLLRCGLDESVPEMSDDSAHLKQPDQNQSAIHEANTVDDVNQSSDIPAVGTNVRYFGDYELLKEIARGGMGGVFRARQTPLNRIVALKMILSGRLATDADVRRFQTEAEAAAQLDHPGIVPVFEVGQHDGHHFYSMALVEGPSLAERIAERRLPPAESAELLKKIATAVAYAHEKGVIHRDLKPSNVLIDPSGDPRVTDFGLAKQTAMESSLTQSGQMLGTPSFMAPEQASGKSDQVRESADIYSLGAILFCMLTGRPPFVADTAAKTLWQVTHDEPPLPRKLNPDIPDDLEAICLKCLEKSPSRRYATASDLRDDLSRFLNHQSVRARRPTVISRAVRWSRRNRRSMFVVVATSAVVLLAVVGFQGAKKWYETNRTGQVSISVASGPTEIGFYREDNPVPDPSMTVATETSIDLPSGDYEIWAERYGQRWQASVLPRKTLELKFQEDDHHEFPLRTANYLGDSKAISLVRRQGRTDLLTDTGSASIQRRAMELHHGWNGDRLWTVEILSWFDVRGDDAGENSEKYFLEIPGGMVTSDFDGDGVGDLALLKASHYMVVSSESGKVLLDQAIEIESKYKWARLSFGEFIDVNDDQILDMVLHVHSELIALDGRDGHVLWQTELWGGNTLRIVASETEPFLFAIDKEKIRVYGLSSGTISSEIEAGESQLEWMGTLDGPNELLLLVKADSEFQAIEISSGRVMWSVAAEDYFKSFSLNPSSSSAPAAFVLEDLTGDGFTDAVMALSLYGDPSIEFMMIEGRQGKVLWRSNIKVAPSYANSRPPAIYGEPSTAPNENGRLFWVAFQPSTDQSNTVPRLHSIDPMSGDIQWTSSLPAWPYGSFWFHQSLDGSLLPFLAIEPAGDLFKRHILHVDKETGAPIRRLSFDRSTGLLMLADIDQDGLADFLTGERSSNTGGVERMDVSLYHGKPRACWRRPGESFPLADLDGDGVADVLTLGPDSTAVSGLTGEVIHRFPAVLQEPHRTSVTSGITHNGQNRFVVQVTEEGFTELDTFVRVMDASTGKVIAEIDDRRKGRWGPDVTSHWTKLFFPDLDGDGQPEIAVTGNRPWRIYSMKDRERLAAGQGLGQTAESLQNPDYLIGAFTGQDGRDRLIEIGSVGPISKTLTVRALGDQGRVEWSTQLPLRENSGGTPMITGVRLDDFDNDGVEDLILWRAFDLWVMEPSTGKLKLHTSRHGQVDSSAVFMVRTDNGSPALVVPHRTLVSADGEVTNNAHQDVARYPNPHDNNKVFVWINNDGRIVAYGPDGVTKLWEASLPNLPSITGSGNFVHDADWAGDVVVQKGNDLFGMDLLSGKKLWRSSTSDKYAGNRLFVLTRENQSTPLIVSTNDKMTVCREAYPVDEQWNYLLPSPTATESVNTPLH